MKIEVKQEVLNVGLVRFIPVDIDRTTASIFTVSQIYPIDRLEAAYKYISGDKSIQNVLVDNGTIMFSDDDKIHWTYPCVIAAYEYYKIARDNHFSFYKVVDKYGNITLLISKQFNNCRLVIDTLTYRAVFVTQKNLRAKLASLIDKKMELEESTRLFESIYGMETGEHKYIDAIIVNRDTTEEYMAVSPIKMPTDVGTTFFEPYVYAELISILNEDTPMTANYRLDAGNIVSMDGQEKLALSTVKYIELLHNRVYASKSNYYEIFDLNNKPVFYVSTNFLYVVDANTFRHYTMRNIALINIARQLAGEHYIDSDRINVFRNSLELNDGKDTK